MSTKSDNAMLTSLGTPDHATFNDGCSRAKPYLTGAGQETYHINKAIERNNTSGFRDWMDWCDK